MIGVEIPHYFVMNLIIVRGHLRMHQKMQFSFTSAPPEAKYYHLSQSNADLGCLYHIKRKLAV